MLNQFEIIWRDSGKEPQCPSDPEFPYGVDLDVSGSKYTTCTIKLPYPAKRIGLYMIKCKACGITAACSTAGRPDDPKSIKLACKTN